MRLGKTAWTAIALVAAAGAVALIASSWRGNSPLAGLQIETIAAIASLHRFGWAAFAGVQILISISGVLPASALGVAAGSIYGVGLGFVLSAAGSLAGATLAFGLSRSVFRPWIERRMRHRHQLQRIDTAIRDDGWRLACLIRWSPIMPFAATSYMLGLSAISFRDYCIGTLGSLPALFGYVMIGQIAGASLEASRGGFGLIRFGLLGAGLLATVVATLRIGRIAVAAIGYQPNGASAVELRAGKSTLLQDLEA